MCDHDVLGVLRDDRFTRVEVLGKGEVLSFLLSNCELKVKWKTWQVQTGDRWYYKVSSTLGFGSMVLLIFQCGPFCTVSQYVLYLSLWTVSYLSLWTVSLLETIEHNCNFNLVLDSPTVQSVDLHIFLELVFSSPFQEEKQNTIA